MTDFKTCEIKNLQQNEIPNESFGLDHFIKNLPTYLTGNMKTVIDTVVCYLTSFHNHQLDGVSLQYSTT